MFADRIAGAVGKGLFQHSRCGEGFLRPTYQGVEWGRAGGGGM